MAGQISVKTPELAIAAGVIGQLAPTCNSARGSVRSAAGETGAFGGESVGDAFSGLCDQAAQSVTTLGALVEELSRNVAMAGLGYVKTDMGVLPLSLLRREPGGRGNP